MSLVLLHFNSIKVRLERHALIGAGANIVFQFHKGTIRTRLMISWVATCTQFQFHKGTIRTRKPCFYQVCFHTFQFHKGTIRTSCSCLSLAFSLDFNSIKVRLERNELGAKGYLYTYFNSIKVRLEL